MHALCISEWSMNAVMLDWSWYMLSVRTDDIIAICSHTFIPFFYAIEE